MAKIKDVYKNDNYYPFTSYCEDHGYDDMKDLAKFEFSKLQSESDFSPVLLSKIKTIYVLYCKQHFKEFVSMKKPAPKQENDSSYNAELEQQLKTYFQANEDKLIRIADVAKAIAIKAKRADIIKVLDEAPWCKTVDEATFFYSK